MKTFDLLVCCYLLNMYVDISQMYYNSQSYLLQARSFMEVGPEFNPPPKKPRKDKKAKGVKNKRATQ